MSSPWLDPAWSPPASKRVTVVFVHGAIVRGWEMALLRRRLRQLGYRVRQFRYRSMMKGLDDNVRRLSEIRRVFEQSPDPRPGRLIAIGSPLLDCWVGRRFYRMHRRIGRLLIGRTVADHISRLSDPVWRGARDFGVLAGTYRFGIGAIFQSLPRPSDGVVLLNETQLQGLSDHSTIRLNHFGMLFSKRCAAQIACFLATGSFANPPSAEETVAA